MKFIEFRIYVKEDYQADIEEVAEALKDAICDFEENNDGTNFPIKDVTYELREVNH